MARPVDKALTAIGGQAKYELCTEGAAVHIGGKHDPADLFVPEIHARKPGWGDDTYLRIRHTDAQRSQGEKHRLVKGRGKARDQDAVEWQIGGRIHHFLPAPLEHTITYTTRADAPADGREIFAIDFPAHSLDWYYQRALRPEESAAGQRQPEKVVGNYAVYGQRSGNLVGPDGTPLAQYETGKFCHVYRPQLIAADGKSVWCDLRYDADRKQLVVSMPLDFLGSAQYPLQLDPEFGYHSNGGNGGTLHGYCVGLKKSTCWRTAGENETVTTMWAYGIDLDVDQNCDLGIYTVSGGNPSARMATATVILPATLGWAGVNINYELSSGTTYTLCAGNFTGDAAQVYWDMRSDGDGCMVTSQALPNPFGTPADTAQLYSIYAEYAIAASSGGGGPFPHYTRRRMVGGMIEMGEGIV